MPEEKFRTVQMTGNPANIGKPLVGNVEEVAVVETKFGNSIARILAGGTT
ncbi:MAG: hypothetical protein CSYNP_03383 [Syntrophus sp. SKADARSKE-3]|nr:hypothetical protein [Syntrophus sp. SKADARSKE-3]